MDDRLTQSVRWGVQRRLEFIDFRLFWDGHFNRRNLMETFGTSAQQASADISQYESLAPTNLDYDRVQKRYVRTPSYKPILVGASADRFLLQLVGIESGWIRREQTWFERLPPAEIVTLGRRPTDSGHLLRILDAIRGNEEIDVEYHSMTGSPTRWRAIAPHNLVYSAGRWYARAWAREHNDFRDYNLNRMRRVGEARASPVNPALDYEWAHRINLVLGPNPKLTVERQQAVAIEHEMSDRRLLVPCRLSLSFYLMAEHNLDVPSGRLSPEKQQLVLLNRAEVEQARSSTRQLSMEALARAGLA